VKDTVNRRLPWVPPELAGPDGLVGLGGDLRPPTLLRAYSEGVFPWFNEGDPILWWSPDPRAVIELDGLHVSRSLLRTIRKGKFRVTANRAFRDVMRGCGETRVEGTWITKQMLTAYEDLHRIGHAHSIETWVRADAVSREASAERDEDWVLAGGVYGVSIGALFAGESMFHRVTDASKVALVALVGRLRERGYELFDVQMRTDHTTRMGATEIPRAEYLKRLRAAVAKTDVRFT
jgi:leucyl/phenylalanyl-tRNA--protein transferase